MFTSHVNMLHSKTQPENPIGIYYRLGFLHYTVLVCSFCGSSGENILYISASIFTCKPGSCPLLLYQSDVPILLFVLNCLLISLDHSSAKAIDIECSSLF